MRRTLPWWLAAACASAPEADDPVDTDPTPDTDVGRADTDDTQPVETDEDPDTDDTTDTDEPVDTDAGPDLRASGPHTVDVTSGTTTVPSGCALHWTRYTAQGGAFDALVVLTHGLQRDETQMSVWGRHLASWGLDVVTPSTCNIDVWNLDQEQNGVDLVDLATALGATQVVYVGHSAGGLASFVAASRDDRTRGLFGLDPVEWLGIGAAAAPLVTARTLALWGDDSTCNAFGSAPGLIDAVAGSQRLRVVDADHCDFEQPTDIVCTLPCGRSPNTRFTDAEIRATIKGMMTAAVLELEGEATPVTAWWGEGGGWYDRLRSEGRID